MKDSKRSLRRLLALVITSATLACERGQDTEPRTEFRDASDLPDGVTTDVTLAPDGAFIVPAAQAPSVIRQCSRATPPPPDSFWTPTRNDIAVVDEQLLAEVRPAFWARWRDTYRSVKAPELRPPRYIRQYVGLAYGERRVIYVNGFMPHVAISDDSAERAWYGDETDGGADAARAALRERLGREGYVVCDGGEWYFGVEYEPGRGRCRNLHFNGRG